MGSGTSPAGSTSRSTVPTLGSGGEWGDFKQLLDVFCARQHKHFLAEERGGLQGAGGSTPTYGAEPTSGAGGSTPTYGAEPTSASQATQDMPGGEVEGPPVASAEETVTQSSLGAAPAGAVGGSAAKEPVALFSLERRHSSGSGDEEAEGFMPPPAVPDDGF
eukprot:gene22230-29297_t